MANRQEVIERLQRLEAYFRRNLSNHDLFNQELTCAETILKELDQTEKLLTEKAKRIVKAHNDVIASAHYNGSGWLDLQMQLLQLLKLDGFNVDIDRSTDLMNLFSESCDILQLKSGVYVRAF
ncbi:MAG TPA: hypothetical protein VK666_16985 [Chryseolinea sp.]|nr:hypothetical protein [Chryseolinea sp.]